MNKFEIWVAAIICFVVLTGCGTTNFAPPPVTPEWSVKTKHINLATLREGRALFAHRCIECHTLPSVWRYSSKAWPKIVDSMSRRANLKRYEREAIVAYILAARGQ